LITLVGEVEDFGADLRVRGEEGGDLRLRDADGVGDVFYGGLNFCFIFFCAVDARTGEGRTGWSCAVGFEEVCVYHVAKLSREV
jgi:hypothetical protein